ncbi:MAG: hypothetical protein ACKVXR_11580 [Planctomycetota bacterium]
MTRKMMFACMLSFVLGCCCTAFTMTCCWPASTEVMTGTTTTLSAGSTQTAWQPSRSTDSLWSGHTLATQPLGWQASNPTALDGTSATEGHFGSALTSTTTITPWQLPTTRHAQWDFPTAELRTSAITRSTTNLTLGTDSWGTRITPTSHTTAREWNRATAFTGRST